MWGWVLITEDAFMGMVQQVLVKHNQDYNKRNDMYQDIKVLCESAQSFGAIKTYVLIQHDDFVKKEVEYQIKAISSNDMLWFKVFVAKDPMAVAAARYDKAMKGL